MSCPNNESWYNNACIVAKGELLDAIKSKSQAQIVKSRARHRVVISNAKREWEEWIWSDLHDALVNRDKRDFWKSVVTFSRGKKPALTSASNQRSGLHTLVTFIQISPGCPTIELA